MIPGNTYDSDHRMARRLSSVRLYSDVRDLPTLQEDRFGPAIGPTS